MAFFRSLQDSAFTEWFLGSDSIWTYPTVLTLHTIGMAILVGASFVIHLRILQVAGAIPLQRLQPLYRFVWIGFAINLLSGLVLFITEAADRIVDPVFYVKLSSIAVALWFGVIVKRAVIDRADGSLQGAGLEPFACGRVAGAVDGGDRVRPTDGLSEKVEATARWLNSRRGWSPPPSRKRYSGCRGYGRSASPSTSSACAC